MKTILKTIVALICVFAAIFGMWSCSDDLLPDDETENKGNVVLIFRNPYHDGTRSDLQSEQIKYSTVKKVLLLIFNGTTADATLLRAETADWSGGPRQTYRLKENLPEGTYTIVAVGVDDRADTTYGLTDENYIDPTITLAQLQAKLQSGKTADDMAHSDFYVGKTEEPLTVQTGAVKQATITMKRRESGVMLYLKNVPASFKTISGEDIRVEKIQLCLNRPQNTDMPLLKPEDEASDFGGNPLTGSETLIDIPTTEDYGYSVSSNGTLEFAGYDRPGFVTMPNTVYGGAFMLPLQQASLTLKMIGVSKVTNETKEKTFPIKYNDEGMLNAEFDIQSNHLYHIGFKKFSGENTSEDRPEDLSGQTIYIESIDWDEIDEDITFPSIRKAAQFVDELNHGANYIFDSTTGIDSIYIIKSTNDINLPGSDNDGEPRKWTLKVADDCDWIHFVEYDAATQTNKYYKEVSSYENKMVYIQLNDYVRYNPGLSLEAIKNDIRKAVLTLTTEGFTQKYEYPIRQYNAITIKNTNLAPETPKVFAINRLDYGWRFNRKTGEPELIPQLDPLLTWGFYVTDMVSIVGTSITENKNLISDGLWVTNTVYKKWWDDKKTYPGSLIQKTRRESIEVDNSGNLIEDKDNKWLWFTPAREQLIDIQNKLFTRLAGDKEAIAKEVGQALNFFDDKLYWSSSTQYGPSTTMLTPNDSFAYDLLKKAEFGNEWKNNFYWDRTEKCRVRQARYFKTFETSTKQKRIKRAKR